MSFTDPLRAGYLHDTERDVLGVLVRYPARIAELLPQCGPDTFHHDDHRALFQRLAARVAEGRLTDPTTLGELDLPLNERLLLADLLEFDRGSSPHRAADRIASLNRLADVRTLRLTARRILDDALDPGERTAEQIVAEGQAAVMALGTRHANGGGLLDLADGLDDLYDGYEDRRLNPGRLAGLPTGLPQLDAVFSGLMPGDLTIIAARPSVGKTSLALNIAENLACYHPEAGRSLIYSMEMSRAKLTSRLVCSLAGLNAKRLKTATLHPDEYDRFHEWRPFIDKMPIKIDSTGSIDIGTLDCRARQAHAQGRVALIIVDYIQIMGRPDQKNENDAAAIQKITSRLKGLAMALNVHVIALSQLNRKSEEQQRRPRPSDLRESGAIEQDADNIIFIHREGFNDAEVVDGSARPAIVPAELIISKQRDGERGLIVPVGFRGEFTKFVPEVPAAVFQPSAPTTRRKGLAEALTS